VRELRTIGYEAATPSTFLAALASAGVDLLVDVRAVASSRRPGFAKTRLAQNLAGVGIEYVHLRALGTPAEGRAAARAGRHPEMRAIYLAHLSTAAARAEMNVLAALVRTRQVCLLCLESDPSHCHRSLVAAAVGELLPVRVTHLHPADPDC
jgi:uncharacterized protein (DUF488 family)